MADEFLSIAFCMCIRRAATIRTGARAVGFIRAFDGARQIIRCPCFYALPLERDPFGRRSFRIKLSVVTLKSARLYSLSMLYAFHTIPDTIARSFLSIKSLFPCTLDLLRSVQR